MQEKIKKLSTIIKISGKLKKEGKKIVLCHGVFDLLHPGHIRHLKSAKAYGDILIVTITADKYVNKGPGRPVFNQNLRAETLEALSAVDYVSIVNFTSAVEAINKIKPDFYVKGPDYKNRKLNDNIPHKLDEEKNTVEKYGGKLLYTDDQVVFSSSKIIGDYLGVYPPAVKRYLDRFRSKYNSDFIQNKFQSLEKQKILIIGDAIIDQYHYCLPMGKSSKEPVMVEQYVSGESYIGGVLATANHTAALSKEVTLLTVLGKKKSYKNFIGKKLKKTVKQVFFFEANESTIIKRRFLDINNSQKLFQIGYMKEDNIISEKTEKQICSYLKKNLNAYHLVIVNDFGHGLMTPKIIRLICKKAKFLALNVQTNSANFGYNIVTKYKRADFVCIDNQEIRLAAHDRTGDLRILIKKISGIMHAGFMIVTKGPKGSIGYSEKSGYNEAPALSDRIVDRVGAGDALFAISAPCVAGGFPDDLVVFIGNVAGALKVQVVGNKKQIEYADMVKFITRLLK